MAGRRDGTLKQACFQGYPESAVYVQVSIDSRNSAIHNAYHSSLRPSSLFEPRHSSLKVVNEKKPIERRQTSPPKRPQIEKTQNGKIRVGRGGDKHRKEVRRHTRCRHPSCTCRPRVSCTKVSLDPEKSLEIHPCTEPHTKGSQWLDARMRANDPSAGSPTETLLRLLLPLSDKVHQTFHCGIQKLNTAAVRIIHRITQSVGATGGVYKGQGRNQNELMTRSY